MRGRGPGRGTIRRKTSGGRTVYMGSWTDAHGRRHRRILAESRREAERILAKIVRARDLETFGLGREEDQERFLDEIVQLYLEDLAGHRRARYVDSVTYNIQALLDWLGPTRVRDLTVERCLVYRRRRVEDGVSNRTANMATMPLRTCLDWAARTGLIFENPIKNLRPLPTDESNQVKRRRAMTDDEIGKFLAAAHEIDRERSARFLAEKTIASGAQTKAYAARRRKPAFPQLPMWKALIATGMRWGEIVTLRWADVDEKERTFTVRPEIAKGRRLRVVPVQQGLLDEVLALRRLSYRVTDRLPGPPDQVFLRPKGSPWPRNANGNANAELRKILERAGIAPVDAAQRSIDVHALRVTSSTRMLRHGVPLHVVARILGHRDVRLTMRHYEDLTVTDVRGAVDDVPAIVAAARTRPGSLPTGISG